jgi:DNA-directed RNA polymerase subunit K/omega
MIERITSKGDLDERSRYELVMIAAREARRLNDAARINGKELKRRVTKVAWERLLEGKIAFTYDDPAPEGEADIPDLAAEAEEAAAEAAAKQHAEEGV